MFDKITINTETENGALIPDKWVVGNGLSTNSLYVTHTSAPLMIIQSHQEEQGSAVAPYTMYMKGEVSPKLINTLFSEALEIIKIYKGKPSMNCAIPESGSTA
jgi:hypothetical protein